jgi:hypothetical protein
VKGLKKKAFTFSRQILPTIFFTNEKGFHILSQDKKTFDFYKKRDYIDVGSGKSM